MTYPALKIKRGHKIPGSREAYYDSSKTEKLREKYSRVDFRPRGRFEEEEFLRKIASFHGLDYDEVLEEAREIYGEEIDQEKVKKHLRWKIEDRKKSRKKQEIIQEEELREYLDSGYEVECELSDGRFIVSKEESILDLLEGGEGRKVPS
ncbi:hypothetical protein AKJ57_06075 [candidate division MSBL1 archaeon SCGC-AAA259A05]|uniref:Uncharacterized protein n=1 Tax=candidate division MSBL1 archaeon SCGC-AAA259A05 TaxID=1698259 RepID=A0A133U426_9EURY|nr:hypothetical protein AKJ57_06075 [candidate division MSBL1 archaeon SCGC-AAA259A05]